MGTRLLREYDFDRKGAEVRHLLQVDKDAVNAANWMRMEEQ